MRFGGFGGGNELIVRPLAKDLGFDEYGQLRACFEKDGALIYTIVHDLRGKTCPICGHGWELSATAFSNEYHWNITDESVHQTCWVGYMGIQEARMWHDALIAARGNRMLVWTWKKIPNEYGGAWNTPWYYVSFGALTEDGKKPYLPKLKLGLRKRVYHMSLHDLTKDQIAAAEAAFKDQETTKWFQPETGQAGIHAWTEERATHYLQEFIKIIVDCKT